MPIKKKFMIKYTPRPRAIARLIGLTRLTRLTRLTWLTRLTRLKRLMWLTRLTWLIEVNLSRQMNNQDCTFLKIELRLYSLLTSKQNTFSFQSAIYLLITPRLLRGSRSKFICILMNGSKSLVKYNKQ